ncbi:hypothetical protein TNCT_375411 [Trichonephila clavata]|uniref:Uncharacterized protein n=1 Tax=Trichonephila clavata TaxID=2740835 RepID=A0A8X6H6R0_TRICU|nr:hypothetical protein TNCT_375411 [Trichonephila clavata]
MSSSHGFDHYLTCVYSCTRWKEAIRVINAETVAHAFYGGWISLVLGCFKDLLWTVELDFYVLYYMRLLRTLRSYLNILQSVILKQIEP